VELGSQINLHIGVPPSWNAAKHSQEVTVSDQFARTALIVRDTVALLDDGRVRAMPMVGSKSHKDGQRC
jgi:hypothetical protein